MHNSSNSLNTKKGLSSPILSLKCSSPPSKRIFDQSKIIKNQIKTNSSSAVTTKSVKILPKLYNTFEEEFGKLEKLIFKNYSVRNTWLEIEQKLIQIDLKRKLDPIPERYAARKGVSIDFYMPRPPQDRDIALV